MQHADVIFEGVDLSLELLIGLMQVSALESQGLCLLAQNLYEIFALPDLQVKVGDPGGLVIISATLALKPSLEFRVFRSQPLVDRSLVLDLSLLCSLHCLQPDNLPLKLLKS